MKAICALAAGASLLVVGAATAADDCNKDLSERAIHVCAGCHGEGGNSTSPQFPKLAGQQPVYFAEQLKLFRSQVRSDPSPQAYMWGVSALLDDATIQGLADYFAAQKPAPGKPANPRLAGAGRRIYEEGIPAKGVQACSSCHGAEAEGTAAFPRLAGQYAEYTVRQLQQFQTRVRPHAAVMTKFSKGLSRDEMQAVAAYLQSK